MGPGLGSEFAPVSLATARMWLCPCVVLLCLAVTCHVNQPWDFPPVLSGQNSRRFRFWNILDFRRPS